MSFDADLRNKITRNKWGEWAVMWPFPVLAGMRYSPAVMRINEGAVGAAYHEIRHVMLITGERAGLSEPAILEWLLKDSPGIGRDEKVPEMNMTPRAIAADLIRVAQDIAAQKAAGTYVESERYRDARLKSERIARGEIELVFRYEDDEPDEKPPTPAQVAAIRHLRDNESSVVSAVVAAMAADARRNAANLHENASDPQWAAAICPDDLTDQQMRERMRAEYVVVTDRERDGLGYLELNFSLAWDEEHQYYAVTHGNRVIGVFDSGGGWSDE